MLALCIVKLFNVRAMTDPDQLPETMRMAVDEEVYDAMDSYVQAFFEGRGLATLAEEDPYAAYRFLKEVMIADVRSTPESAISSYQFSDGTTITSDEDGDAPRLATIASFEDRRHSIIVRPVDVQVMSTTTEERKGRVLLHFVVEPPSLA